MKKVTIIGCLLVGLLLSGCQALERKKHDGAAVQLRGNYLYRSSLDALTIGMNPEDSAQAAQQYIAMWAKDILVYDAVNAGQTGISRSEIDRLVEDYRRALYVQAYEEWLVDQQMSKDVADTIVEQLYSKMPNRFMLQESVVKGLLVVVPKGAPNIGKLRAWMKEEKLDEIEKYAYQIANEYDLFTDKWMSTSDLISHIPLERNEIESSLKNKSQIEVTDSLHMYLLQVTDKQLKGTPMPVEYAREEIEKIVLNERQVEFLQQERNRLYDEAVKNGEVVYY